MDPSTPIPSGRNMLEELPPELLIHIFGEAIDVETEEVGVQPTITSKPLLYFSRFTQKASDAGLSVVGKSSLAWQSRNTCACYLEALQKYVVEEQSAVSANILNLNFTNMNRFLAAAAKKGGILGDFDTFDGDNTRWIEVSHRITRDLKPEPPTFSAWCKKIKRMPEQEKIEPSIEHSISKVEDVPALDDFLEAHAGFENGLAGPLEDICYLFKQHAFREAINPAANRPGPHQTEAIKLSRDFEHPYAQANGFGDRHNLPRHTYPNRDPSRYRFGEEDV